MLTNLIFFSSLTTLFHLATAQQTGIECSAVTPINVPKDPSLYWGTWYTIGTCDLCTSPENVCTQVAYEPDDATNLETNVTYIGSYQNGSPEGTIAQAFGSMFPSDIETFDPLYRFDLPLGDFVIESNFWVLTTAGDGDDISAIVTMSCLIDGSDQQLFFLSRKPYLVAPVTFDSLVDQTRRAITNYDEFNITTVYQGQGWCEYDLTETYTDSSSDSDSDCEEVNETQLGIIMGFVIASSFFIFIISAIIIHSKCCAAKDGKGGLRSSEMVNGLMA